MCCEVCHVLILSPSLYLPGQHQSYFSVTNPEKQPMQEQLSQMCVWCHLFVAPAFRSLMHQECKFKSKHSLLSDFETSLSYRETLCQIKKQNKKLGWGDREIAQCRPEGLRLGPGSHVSWTCGMYGNPRTEGWVGGSGDRWILGTSWPASLTEMANFKFSEKLCLHKLLKHDRIRPTWCPVWVSASTSVYTHIDVQERGGAEKEKRKGKGRKGKKSLQAVSCWMK